MASMRDAVAQKVQAIEQRHQAMKQKRFGFLVRPAVLIIGWVVVIVGLITIPFPGPGWLTVFVGVGILSLEVKWAHRLLDWGIKKYEQFFDWYQGKNKPTRYFIIFLICLCVWIAVGSAMFGAWYFGAFPALDPVMDFLEQKWEQFS